jgi:aldose 1-epimerase
MNLKINLIVATFLFFACACSSPSVENRAGISKAAFEKTLDGKQISLWTLKNKNGAEMCVTNYGGKVVSLFVPDKNNNFIDVVTGFDCIDKYLKSGEIYFGAAIGRVGNRIALGKFSLNGTEYHLPINNGPNSLHGGPKGFHAVVWDAKQIDKSTLELSYLAKDTEEGYPGNLLSKIIYKLTDDNEFSIEYYATTDKPTVCNLTHHSYFNLSGEGNETILDHVLQIPADSFTPTDADLIPTGEIVSVAGTPLDFRTPTVIGERINSDFDAIKKGFGYDHNFVLNKTEGKVELAATVYSPISGIEMDVYTDQPGIQLYSGNFMNGKEIGITNKPYKYRSAFCLETQHFPDSPNKPNFPSITLNPGETYRHTCIYKFSIKK